VRALDISKEIVGRLQRHGHAAFWVGGCVRDFLLGREPVDFDIATSAKPDEIERLFQKTAPVGRQFGVMLVIEHEQTFEVATFRSESDYEDGRRPSKVEFSNAEADARRRDFTVNGLFYDPVAERLHDWVGGENDLKTKRLRTIGPAEERFAEDRLRLLRAVRLAAQLNFTIEDETFRAVQAHASEISRVSVERIRDELLKLFWPPHAARGLDLLRESGLLNPTLPELVPMISCEQSPEYHPEGSVYEHTRLVLANLPDDPAPTLPWAALLHDVGKPATFARESPAGPIHFYGHEKVGAEIAEELLRRLRFPRKQMDEIVFCVRRHMQFKDAPNMRQATLRRLLLRPTFPIELELHRVDCLGSHRQLDIHDFLVRESILLAARPDIQPPLVDGRDLLDLGMPEGPALGKLLAEIREKQLQDELKTRSEGLAWAKSRLKEI